MKPKAKASGFTLVELVVVMSILLILAAISIPRFTKVINETKDKTNAANILMIKSSAEIYWANETVANADKALELGGSAGKEVVAGHVLVDQNYLKNTLKDPKNNEVYIIKVTSTNPLKIVVEPKDKNGY